MKFKINNRNWIIKETSKDWLLEQFKKENSDGVYCFGLTRYYSQEIFLNQEVNQEVKKQTLYHELMHCYIWNFLHSCDNYGEEVLCDISANSHDIIHKIVEDYFKGGNKK